MSCKVIKRAIFMLADVIIRKATKRDVRQLALKQVPELVIQVIPNIVLPLGLLTLLWLNIANPILKIVISIPLVIWAVLFIVVMLFGIGQILGFIFPHSASSTQWVAVYGRKAIAEATLDTYEEYYHLHQLVVQSQFQRQGIGSCLVHQLCQESAKPVYVQAEKQILNFWLQLGFKLIEEDELPEELKEIFNCIRNTHKDKRIQDLVIR